MSVDPRLTRRKVTVSLALSLLAGRALGSSASAQERGKPLAAGDRITRLERVALWLSLDSERAHNPKVAGSNPAPATIDDEGLADATAANPFALPRLTQDSVRPSRLGAVADTVTGLEALELVYELEGIKFEAASKRA